MHEGVTRGSHADASRGDVRDLYPVCASAAVQAVALGAAVQAGILQGDVSDVMVMDIWQASLMRAFAEQQLRDGHAAAASTEEAAEPSDVAGPESKAAVVGAADDVTPDDPEAAAREEEEWGPADLESLKDLTNVQ